MAKNGNRPPNRRAKVFVTHQLVGTALDRLAKHHDVTVWPQPEQPTREELINGTRDADGLLCMLSDTIDEQVLAASPNLRAIANYAVGTDNIDLRATQARGIAVGNTPDVLTEAT